MKSKIVHARVDADIKKESESILLKMGFNLSEAISLFLRQIVLKKGIPFKFDIKEREDYSEIAKLAFAVNSTGGTELTEKEKKILDLYARGYIDYDTFKLIALRGF